MTPLLPFLWLRAKYAEWALNHIPPLVDGKFNPEYQKLSNYIRDERLRKYFEGK